MGRIWGTTLVAALGIIAAGWTGLAHAGFRQLTLDWTDNASSEAGYRVERAPGTCSVGSVFAEIAQLPPGSVHYVDTPLTAGLSFCYRVRAVSNDLPPLFSDYSNTAGGTVDGAAPGTLTVR